MSSQEQWDQSHYSLDDDALTLEEHDRFNIGWRRLMGTHHQIPFVPLVFVLGFAAVAAVLFGR